MGKKLAVLMVFTALLLSACGSSDIRQYGEARGGNGLCLDMMEWKSSNSYFFHIGPSRRGC
jgi:major membrane immunogen (membrane-anchored lipoprotein)